eukprot:CAMPEP_0181289478 /NCGR_PEP_ID=MMETSP1101-20121128/902_1 /TAXON_ID=46948 /ORGANISM="Rhodomonas abbreviata, Strain Caron Lab Isolate" /LENGTH=208 /DNA_ID=CAMNT_0023393699 /DNA_START=12 /DNA_END=634 /DNA_ORIENTATION=-
MARTASTSVRSRSARLAREAASEASEGAADKAPATSASGGQDGGDDGGDGDDDESWRLGPCRDRAGFSMTTRRWVVLGVDGWRDNLTLQTIEFHVLWATGRPSWEPLAGSGEYARSVSEFLKGITGPPPPYRDRQLERRMQRQRLENAVAEPAPTASGSRLKRVAARTQDSSDDDAMLVGDGGTGWQQGLEGEGEGAADGEEDGQEER